MLEGKDLFCAAQTHRIRRDSHPGWWAIKVLKKLFRAHTFPAPINYAFSLRGAEGTAGVYYNETRKLAPIAPLYRLLFSFILKRKIRSFRIEPKQTRAARASRAHSVRYFSRQNLNSTSTRQQTLRRHFILGKRKVKVLFNRLELTLSCERERYFSPN